MGLFGTIFGGSSASLKVGIVDHDRSTLSARLFVPLNQLPTALQDAVHVLPLTYLSDALHHVLNDGDGLAAIGVDLGVLVAWAAVCFTIAVLRFRWE